MSLSMKTIALGELKSIQLDLSQKTADFCELKAIRCFLCGGTLIGGIRHRGYIPWDDDIDFGKLPGQFVLYSKRID